MPETLPIHFAKVRAVRAHEVIVEQLQNLILGKKLAPGDRLPSEREMMVEFQVSRPTVREALRVAESMGLISVRSGDPGGPKVLGTPALGIARVLDSLIHAGQASSLELLEWRVALDSSAAILASIQPKKQLASIRTVLQRMEATENPHEFAELDAGFHEAIIVASGNRLFELLFRGLSDPVRSLIEKRLAALPGQTREKTLQQHGSIASAIEAGDGQKAARAVREHLVDFYAPMLPAHDRRRFTTYVDALAQGSERQRGSKEDDPRVSFIR